MDHDDASGPVSEAPYITYDDRERRGTEWLSVPGQSYFGLNGPRMRQQGWAVLPQERDIRRKVPLGIRWKEHQDAAPTLKLTERWATAAPGANAAILLGPVSGNVICLDIDVMDEDLSLHIQEIAEELLGLTPFRRIGKRPKIALFYRLPAGVTVPNRTYSLMTADGTAKSEHAIEVQGRGKMMTAFGLHHETGATFKWQDCRPWQHGPELAPEVTAEMLDGFFAEVESRARPFHRKAGAVAGADAQWDYVDADGVDRPRLRQDAEFAGYARDAEGFVYDGRETFVWLMASQAARLNPAACADERGVAKIIAAAFQACGLEMKMVGRWSEGYLRQEVSEKVRRACAGVASGDIKPIFREGGVVLTADGLSAQITRTKNLVDTNALTDAFSWLPKSGKSINAKLMKGHEGSAEMWALKEDRSAIHAKVTATIDQGLQAFAADVRAGKRNGPIHVIKAPTGSGKTVRSVEFIMKDPDTVADDALPRDQRRGAFAFLMPTYANIDEVRPRALAMGLDPELNDQELEAAAAELGLLSEKGTDDLIAEIREKAANSPARTMVYKGKLAAGCLMADRMRNLIDADIGASGLCKSTIKGADGGRQEVTCPHYDVCPAIAQKRMLADHHIAFMPRSFLTLNIPEEAKNFRGVIADETTLDLLAHTNIFPLAALDIERKEPTLTKSEREAGADPAYMLKQRGLVRDAVVIGLKAGKDPAKYLREKMPTEALELVRIAKRVCSSAIASGQAVRPGMSDTDFQDLVKRPTSEYVKAEFRFWSLIQEDMEANLLVELAGKTPRRDTRIKLLTHDVPEICLGWRAEPNWAGLPFLLLDASANETLLERVFTGRDIVTYECENDANLRVVAFPDQTFAVSKLLGRTDRVTQLEAAYELLKIRRAIVSICAAHSNGRVAVCMTKPVRQVICAGWVPPLNADFMHDGATAGLDFAKTHVALISIGRTELPVATVDGLVAAYTHDIDDRPPCIDVFGTGKDAKGKGIRPHTANRFLKLRDGNLALCQHQQHESYFARAVQAQAREEAIRQRIGRVRGVFREIPGIVYLLGEAIPDDVVIDDLRSMSDLLGYEILDAARRLDGILSSEMIAYNAADEWTIAAAEKAIQKLGARILRNYNKVSYVGADGETRIAHVPVHLQDHDNGLLRSMMRKLRIHADIISTDAGADYVVPHKPRQPDALELALGTIEERREIEEGVRRELIEHAMSVGEYQPASATPFGKQAAKYRLHPETDEIGEAGQIQIYRMLTAQTKSAEDTAVSLHAIISEGLREAS
nr:bifunctional DNA primase/polymerase [uncultured Devosia sp.]